MFAWVLFAICSIGFFALLFFTFVKPVERLVPLELIENFKWEQLRRKEKFVTFEEGKRAYEREQEARR